MQILLQVTKMYLLQTYDDIHIFSDFQEKFGKVVMAKKEKKKRKQTNKQQNQPGYKFCHKQCLTSKTGTCSMLMLLQNNSSWISTEKK